MKIKELKTSEQIEILGHAFGALVCGAGFGMFFGFGQYAGRVWYDLQSGIAAAVFLGAAFFVAVVVCALFEGGEK